MHQAIGNILAAPLDADLPKPDRGGGRYRLVLTLTRQQTPMPSLIGLGPTDLPTICDVSTVVAQCEQSA